MGTLAHLHLSSLWAGVAATSQGRILFKNHFDISLPGFLSQQESLFVGGGVGGEWEDLKKKKKSQEKL